MSFLLDEDGDWIGRWGWEHPMAVQAGHATSRFSGLTERFLLEDADYNQMRSIPERRGHVLTRTGIEIGGVPVELESARYWRDTGYLADAVFDSAPYTWGW